MPILANFVGGLATIGLATCMLPLIYASRFERRGWRSTGQAELVLFSLLAGCGIYGGTDSCNGGESDSCGLPRLRTLLSSVQCPLLAISVMVLLAKRFRIECRDAYIAISCLIFGFVLLFFLADPSVVASPFNFLNAPSWFLWQHVLGGFKVLSIGLLAVAFVALFHAVAHRRLHTAVVGLILFLAFQTCYFSANYLWLSPIQA